MARLGRCKSRRMCVFPGKGRPIYIQLNMPALSREVRAIFNAAGNGDDDAARCATLKTLYMLGLVDDETERWMKEDMQKLPNKLPSKRLKIRVKPLADGVDHVIDARWLVEDFDLESLKDTTDY